MKNDKYSDDPKYSAVEFKMFIYVLMFLYFY